MFFVKEVSILILNCPIEQTKNNEGESNNDFFGSNERNRSEVGKIAGRREGTFQREVNGGQEEVP